MGRLSSGVGVETSYNRGFVELQLGAATATAFALLVVIGAVTAFQFWFLRDRD